MEQYYFRPVLTTRIHLHLTRANLPVGYEPHLALDAVAPRNQW